VRDTAMWVCMRRPCLGSGWAARRDMDVDWCLLLLEHSPDALIVTDAQDTISFWNPGAERMFGYRADEALGQRLEALLPGPQPADGMPAAATHADGPGMETVRRHRDGQWLYVNLSRRPVSDAQG